MQQVEAEKKNDKRLNDLDGRAWTRNSISVWNVVKTADENKLNHPAMFPVELCKRLIEIYTKKGDTVMDPFMGSGSTLVAAWELDRRGLGFEINPDFVALTRRRLSQEKLLGVKMEEPQATLVEPKSKQAKFARVERAQDESAIYSEDATKLLDFLKPDTLDLVITSPPYWNIHTRRRTADYKESRPYSDLASDLGNISDYPQFLKELGKVFEGVHTVLKPGKRCVVIVMDLRYGSRFIPFHADVSKVMEDSGFVLEDIIIWNRGQEYNSLRPLGYPYVFMVNKVHEYILIFRRDRSTEAPALPGETDEPSLAL